MITKVPISDSIDKFPYQTLFDTLFAEASIAA